MLLAVRNATSNYATRRNKRDDGEAALEALQTRLRLTRLPRRIECYDVSHIQGSDPVASMVVFVDGAAENSSYRSFKIRAAGEQGTQNDDFASMHEVLTRRLHRALEDEEWALPDLIVIDGGKGQLGRAIAAMQDLGIALGTKASTSSRWRRSAAWPCARASRGSNACEKRVARAAERRHQFFLAQHVGQQRQPAERDALPVHRRLHQLVVLVELQRAGGLQLLQAVGVQPQVPFHPRILRVVGMQQHVRGEVGRLAQRPRRVGSQRRAAHRHHGFLEQCGLAFKFFVRPVADGEIHAVALEVDRLVGRGNAHVHARVRLQVAIQARDQPQRSEARRGRHRHGARRGGALQFLGGVLQRIQRVLHHLVKALAAVGEQQRARPPLEQLHPEVLLQGLDLAADCRLRKE